MTLVEHYGYYHGAFDELADYLAGAGVGIWDSDFTDPTAGAAEAVHARDEYGNARAPGRLAQPLMDNLAAATDEHGALVVEVPNMASFQNGAKP